MASNDAVHSSRRRYLKAAGTVGAAGLTGLAGCMGGGGGGKKTINILTWEEYTKLKDEIESNLDVTVEFTKSTSSSRMFSSWQAGKDSQFDIAIPNNNYVPKMMEADLVAPVPKDTVSNYPELYDQFHEFADQQFTADGSMYGVPIRFGWYGYSYNGDQVPDHEESYKALFEPEYTGTDLSGQLIMYDNHFKAMSAAALYLGYRDAFSGSKVTLSQSQIDEVKKTMKAQKDILQGYIAADPSYIKSFKQENFMLGQSGRNEIVEMWTQGTDWPKMATPKEGSLAWFESAVVSKKTENKDLAWEVVNQFIAPKLGAKLAQAGFSPSTNPKTQEGLSKKENDMFGAIEPSRLEAMIPFKSVKNEDAWLNAWEEIKSA